MNFDGMTALEIRVRIYLDNHASTPCDPRVVQAMLPYFTESYGNPSSTMHGAGQRAADAVEEARSKVASLINARPREIVFTAGATESNNLALLGVALRNTNHRTRIITSAIEHKSVLGPCKTLRNYGYDVVILPVDRMGRVDADQFEEAITDGTLLVSLQAANNEIGTIQPITEISRIAHKYGAVMHCDAAQATGKIPADAVAWDVDLLSISAHKLYGPKGVGALYIRGGAYGFPISPLWYGGGQEWELRPGTLNAPGIVGFGEACRLCAQSLSEDHRKIVALRDLFEAQLLQNMEGITRNGALDRRLAGNSSLTFHGIDAEALIANMPQLALSTGSACTSGAPEPSHVLLAIGLSREEAYHTIRVGLGRFTTREEIDQAVSMIIAAVERIREVQAEAGG